MVQVEKSTHDLAYWAQRPFVATARRDQLVRTPIVLVPHEGFRDHKGPVYPVGTEEFFQRLQDAAGKDHVDLAVEDADYHELALHHDWLTIAWTVTTLALAPIVVGVAGEYVKRMIWKPGSDRTVRMKMTVKSGNDEAVDLSYEGAPEDMQAALNAAVAALANRPAAPEEEVPAVKLRVDNGADDGGPQQPEGGDGEVQAKRSVEDKTR